MKINGRGYIYRYAKADLKTLQELLESSPRWAYVAGLARANILVCTPDLPRAWPQGRAFGAVVEFEFDRPLGLEVRWQKAGESYRVDVLTEDTDWQQNREDRQNWQAFAEEIDGLQTRDILLWGKMDKTYSDDPTWIEARIPQILKYPIKIAKAAWPADPDKQLLQLRLVVSGYDYTVGGAPVVTRWAWLQQGPRIDIHIIRKG